jgi:sec-independent protein translocase protein TatA
MFEDLLKPQHLLLILAVALLVFGPSKLPELGKGLAQGIKNFKDAIKGEPEATAADTKKSTEKPS